MYLLQPSCQKFDPVPCAPDPGFGCRGNKLRTKCRRLPTCNDQIPVIEFSTDPMLLPGETYVELNWFGEGSQYEIEVMVLCNRILEQPLHDLNDTQHIQDQDSPAVVSHSVGITMDDRYRYMIAVRRLLSDEASPWTITYVGSEGTHRRAFSQGFATGFM